MRITLFWRRQTSERIFRYWERFCFVKTKNRITIYHYIQEMMIDLCLRMFCIVEVDMEYTIGKTRHFRKKVPGAQTAVKCPVTLWRPSNSWIRHSKSYVIAEERYEKQCLINKFLERKLELTKRTLGECFVSASRNEEPAVEMAKTNLIYQRKKDASAIEGLSPINKVLASLNMLSSGSRHDDTGVDYGFLTTAAHILFQYLTCLMSVVDAAYFEH